MAWLEHRIPPVVLMLGCALMMGLAARLRPTLEVSLIWRLPLSLALTVTGVAVCLAGVRSFRRARTTVNPLSPDSASDLVTQGIYRLTRNPMYLGFTLVLAGWAVLLASPFALVGVAAFVLWIDRWQIRSEERALQSLFGAHFAEYCSRTRRWL
ncbi:isoprenylcysteine carboxylmethyltransferase family protein [Pseudomonas nitroreducens]|uniref:Isoprenylcysteine carboxylmethyltransferase family protein n=1 Tax=Pseudomonas nitroreducens TaxID=46680 RepID=A0ABS0KP01_PSENT|nr:isoprenylcysteine carboxylmethyltransferase family protein [Pseudomonas nitroreducens]MBG6289828.1 isoprenylcysteine carboxylmethyltransferase family protein [Pseudomonas nitroreducens]MDG9857367.1 isoprenylcysteine carboxylmethyltransferase family protein [Pseudomonas nitroreducens]MDH1076539.1 isoprenylcysteine carboxylmethyltransferase family protein [Pseudomonas nitroreducens]